MICIITYRSFIYIQTPVYYYMNTLKDFITGTSIYTTDSANGWYGRL